MKMKIREFSGEGNYSYNFNWDNGIACLIGDEVTYDKMEEDAMAGVKYSSTFNFFPTELREKKPGVWETFFNEHGGSRTVRGYVVARSRKEAERLLREHESKYPRKDYEREGETEY